MDRVSEGSTEKAGDAADKDRRKFMDSLNVKNPNWRINNLQELKNELILGCYRWVLSMEQYREFIDWDTQDAPRLLWVNGQAGTGKTMLLMGIIQELRAFSKTLQNPTDLTILHFFCREKSDDPTQANQAKVALKSVLWMLLDQHPQLMQHLDENAKEGFKNDGEYTVTLASELIQTMLRDGGLGHVILLVDALDECEYEPRKSLINFIHSTLANTSNVRVLVSSRPLQEIHIAINGHKAQVPKRIIQVDDIILREPISKFIEWSIDQIPSEDETIPRTVKKLLQERSGNTFLWTALVCQELSHCGLHAYDDILSEIPDGLMALYDKLFAGLMGLKYKKQAQNCKRVLTLATLSLRPLTLGEMAYLAELNENIIESVIRDCRSFLRLHGDKIYIFHQSAQDYLEDHFERLKNGLYNSGDHSREKIHYKIFDRTLMSLGTLKKDIFNLGQGGLALEDIECPSLDPLKTARYSCQFWVHHLEQSQRASLAAETIYVFLS